jgi:hypothetical protein
MAQMYIFGMVFLSSLGKITHANPQTRASIGVLDERKAGYTRKVRSLGVLRGAFSTMSPWIWSYSGNSFN